MGPFSFLFLQSWGSDDRVFRGSRGVPSAQCARSATIWASSRTRNPHIVILGASLLFDNRYFDASSALGIWQIWFFTQFHPFSPFFTLFHTLLGCSLKGFNLVVLFFDTIVWMDEAVDATVTLDVRDF